MPVQCAPMCLESYADTTTDFSDRIHANLTLALTSSILGEPSRSSHAPVGRLAVVAF